MLTLRHMNKVIVCFTFLRGVSEGFGHWLSELCRNDRSTESIAGRPITRDDQIAESNRIAHLCRFIRFRQPHRFSGITHFFESSESCCQPNRPNRHAARIKPSSKGVIVRITELSYTCKGFRISYPPNRQIMVTFFESGQARRSPN